MLSDALKMQNGIKVDKHLIKTHENHIKGYGFLSDLGGTTRYGIPIETYNVLHNDGWAFTEEFVEDPTLPKHIVDNLEIPRGTLKIFIKKLPLEYVI